MFLAEFFAPGHMVDTEQPNSRKRRRSSVESATDNQLPAAKKSKVAQSTKTEDPHRPPGYWDTLSKVWLTRGALREFDRRNDQAAEESLSLIPTTLPTPLGPYRQEIKRFARRGGPNLTHLRGVRLSYL